MSDDPTSRRIDGITPHGGTYSIAFFSHDGRAVPQRFANHMRIVEYDDADRVIFETLGTTTPKALLPRDFVPEGGCASSHGLSAFAASLDLGRVSPRERPISDGPPLATQAVCLARAYVVEGPDRANVALAHGRGVELLEGRSDLEGSWVSVPLEDESRGFVQILNGLAARAATRLPADVDEQDVIMLDIGPILQPATDRLEEVRRRLETEVAKNWSQEAEFSLWLATNALRSEETSRGLWHELMESASRFVEYFERRPPSSIPVDMTREALAGLRSECEQARSHLLLDLLTTAGARVVESVTLAIAASDERSDFDGDAHLRWVYHRFNVALAHGPATETPALHYVAAALVSIAIKEGFAAEIEALAERELAEADKLIADALDLPDDLDGFYWLLFAAALPLQSAEILYRVLAQGESNPDRLERLVNLSEEKRVRVTTSVLADAANLYKPLLAEARKRVQERVRTGGSLAGRLQVMDVIDHTLMFPRWLKAFLMTEQADGEEFWAELMESRNPLRSPFAPVASEAKRA